MKALESLFISFFISVVAAGPILKLLIAMKSRQTVSQHLEGHQVKQGTPTMGGLIILAGAIPTLFLFLGNTTEALLLILFGFIGFADDFIVPKLMPGKRGLGWIPKLAMQVGAAVLALAMAGPLQQDPHLALRVLTILFFCNAYNFADGLDGLAGTLGLILLLGLCALSDSTRDWAVPLALIGGILAFLFFNAPPAKVFMGDVGSLPIGALMGLLAAKISFTGPDFQSVLSNPPFHAALVLSFLMFAELIPVPLQIFWVKVFKKRLFPFTPIHHAFEKAGWPETRVTMSFVLVQILCLFLALSLYVGPWIHGGS